MNLISLSFKTFFRNNRLKFYIVSISITFGTIISIIYNLYLLNNIFSEKIKNNIVNRVVHVNKDIEIEEKDIKFIGNISQIETIYKKLIGFSMHVDDEFDFPTEYVSYQELPQVILGDTLNSNDEAQILLPEKVLDKDNNYVYYGNLVGKKINVSIEDFAIEAKVSGIYKTENYEITMYINDMFKSKLIEYNENIEKSDSAYIVIDSYIHVNDVIEYLKNNGFSANLLNISGQSDIRLYNLASILIIVILVLTVMFNYISVSIMITSIINDEKTDIAILKAIGYNLKSISTILKNRIIAILGTSLLCSLIISFVLNKIINFIILYKLNVVLPSNFKVFLLLFFIFNLCIYIISVISIKINNKKIKKINTIQLLKEN